MTFARRFIGLAALLLASAGPGQALDLQSTTAPGRAVPSLTTGELAINRADRTLFFKNVDGSIARGALMDATAAGRKAVEQGDAGDLILRPGGQLAIRTLLDRLLERPSVINYGVDMTGVADSTQAFQAALNSGRRISAPCGTIRLLSTVSVTSPALFDGPGSCLTLKYDAPGSTPIVPIIDIKSTAAGTRMTDFAFDHQADTHAFTDPTIYGGNLIAGSAILIQANNTQFSRITGRNGYDNCIAVVQLPNSAPWQAIAGQPRGVSLQTIRTSGCGRNQYKAGAGIDVASGAATVVNDHVDTGSYGAFILDIGAGAQGVFSNLAAIGTAFDPARFAFDGTRSQSFYIGAPGSTFINLTSTDAQDRGLWLDGFAGKTSMSNVYIKTSAAEGVLLKSPQATITGLTVNSAGYGKTAGTVDAIVVDTTSAAITNLNLIAPTVLSEFNTARYGINHLGSNPLTGYALGADLGGAVTATHNVPGTFGVASGTALGGAWTNYTPSVACGAGGGTLGTTSATGSYRRVGKTIDVQINVTITDKGSCTYGVYAGLPVATSARVAFAGQETAVGGAGLFASANAGDNSMQIKRYDSASPAVNGYVLTLGGTYPTP